jgi:homoaconitase/3-isopropylmalate dehydratase large subunit
MVLVPGSARIAQRMAAEGLIQAFTDAGAMLLPPGCGPCAGGRSGLLAPGEVSISTAATNTAGRMGAPTSLAYLGSPLTVAASAVTGRITDPREVSCHG